MENKVFVLGLPGDSTDVDTLCKGLAAAGIDVQGLYAGATVNLPPAATVVVVYGPAAASPGGEDALSISLNCNIDHRWIIFLYKTAVPPPLGTFGASTVIDASIAKGTEALYSLTTLVRETLQRNGAALEQAANFPQETLALNQGADKLNQYKSLSGVERTTIISLTLVATGLLFIFVDTWWPSLSTISLLGVVLTYICGPVGIVTYFVWFYRAHKNLEAINALDTKYSSAWTVAGYFVPILNFYRPVQMMVEVWKGSDPEVDITNPSAWKAAKSSALIVVWWTADIAFNIYAFIDSSINPGPGLADATPDNSAISTVAFATLLLTYIIFTVILVRKVTERQRLRYTKLSGGVLPA